MLKDNSNFKIIFVSVGNEKKALIEEQGQRVLTLSIANTVINGGVYWT